MSSPFVGEIRMFAFNFVPTGWGRCDGTLVLISENTTLFTVLGTMYGGDGRTTFALPDLRDRSPIHVGNGYTQGQAGGAAAVTLTTSQIPSHTHAVNARAGATSAAPGSALWAASSKTVFAPNATTTMAANALGSAGGGQPHDNLPPYLTITFGIALQGIFPSDS